MPESNGQNPTPSQATLRDKLRFAFSVGPEYEEKLEEDEERLLSDIASNIHRHRMASAAIPFLLFNKPLNVIGANLVQMGEVVFTSGPVESFLRKFLGPSYSHELLVRTLEKRISIERLVENLETLVDECP
jgi:hypothetical protein